MPEMPNLIKPLIQASKASPSNSPKVEPIKEVESLLRGEDQFVLINKKDEDSETAPLSQALSTHPASSETRLNVEKPLHALSREELDQKVEILHQKVKTVVQKFSNERKERVQTAIQTELEKWDDEWKTWYKGVHPHYQQEMKSKIERDDLPKDLCADIDKERDEALAPIQAAMRKINLESQKRPDFKVKEPCREYSEWFANGGH